LHPSSVASEVDSEREVVATPKRVYQNAHIYHINSISLNSDGQVFLTADDLRINIWDYERSENSYSKCSANVSPFPVCQSFP
jgi:hypothetical protein